MRIKTFTYIYFLCNIISAQTYKNVKAYQDGLSITVKYDMVGELFRGDQVALTYSIDGFSFEANTNVEITICNLMTGSVMFLVLMSIR